MWNSMNHAGAWQQCTSGNPTHRFCPPALVQGIVLLAMLALLKTTIVLEEQQQLLHTQPAQLVNRLQEQVCFEQNLMLTAIAHGTAEL